MPIGRTDVTKRQRRFDLPGAIPLHQGLALVGPAATAVPAEHAVVSNGQSPSANWYPDPMHRYEFRRWDGSRWTDQVSTQGRVMSDPIVRERVPSP